MATKWQEVSFVSLCTIIIVLLIRNDERQTYIFYQSPTEVILLHTHVYALLDMYASSFLLNAINPEDVCRLMNEERRR